MMIDKNQWSKDKQSTLTKEIEFKCNKGLYNDCLLYTSEKKRVNVCVNSSKKIMHNYHLLSKTVSKLTVFNVFNMQLDEWRQADKKVKT